jgi:hypothetical protein
MISFGEVFTFVQSIIGFLVVSDIFYERIIQNKLIPKMNNDSEIIGLDIRQPKGTRCSDCSRLKRIIANSKNAPKAIECPRTRASPDSGINKRALAVSVNEEMGRCHYES